MNRPLRGLPLLLLGLWACTESPEPGVDPQDAGVLDQAVDSALDLAPDPDLHPDAALPAAVGLRLNELDCRDSPQVELYNPGPPGTAAGWALGDGRGRRQRLDALGVLPSGLVALPPAWPIHCASTTVELIDPTGAVVDQGQPPLGPGALTWGRWPDGAGPWQATAPTPGAPNALPEPPGGALLDDTTLYTVELSWAADAETVLARDPGRVQPALLSVDGAPPQEIGVRVVGRDGRAQRVDLRPSFELRFDHPDPAGRRAGLAGIRLDNTILDPGGLRAWLGGRVLRAAGVPAPRVAFARVIANGVPRGLYSVQELIDATYVAWRFPDTFALYTADRRDLRAADVARFSLEVGERSLRPVLSALVALADDPPSEGFFAASAHLIQWDRVLPALAAETWVRNAEGYGAARRLTLHVDPLDQVDLLPDALDGSFRGPPGPYPPAGRLGQLCLAEPDCRQAYEAAYRAVGEALDVPALTVALDAQAQALRDAVAADDARLWGLPHFDANVLDLRAALAARAAEDTARAACPSPEYDGDGDGSPCGFDCDDADPDTAPWAREICGDGKDQSCSGVADDGPCPQCVALERDGHTYWRCDDLRTYAEARANCARLGGTLVRVDSAAENAWLRRIAVGADNWWIGLDDLAAEGFFVGPDGLGLAYEGWADGEPNDAGEGEDCAHLRADGRWNDAACNSRMRSLCEAPCVPEDADGDGAPGCGADCDDQDPLRHPGAEERCDDGIDDDCDGLVDEGCGDCLAQTWGGRRYHFCPEPRDFASAEALCAAQGASLVVVDDAAENAWIHAEAMLITRQRWWIGLSDREEEGRWRWVDGSRLGFAAWTRGEPNDSGRAEDCVHLWADQAGWNDIGCGATHGVICEGPADP